MNNFHIWGFQKPSVDSYKNHVWKKSTFSTHGILLKTTAKPQKDHEKYVLGNLTIFSSDRSCAHSPLLMQRPYQESDISQQLQRLR